MPGKRYDLVGDDGMDSRIPLHNDEAFQHGILFPAKYIGTLDVPRPSSRVEIVAAMRRIRYEFKAKSIKKKKVTICIGVDGVTVSLKKKKKKNPWMIDETRLTIMQHQIYRIFYVSHDSQDLKIFSYIARDSSTNVFKCNVFKTYKKSQAMRIVRTIGQAFEVCHKLGIHTKGENGSAPREQEGDREQRSSSEENERRAHPRSSRRSNSPTRPASPRPNSEGPPQYRETIPSVEERALQQAQQMLQNIAGRPEGDSLLTATPASQVNTVNTASPVMMTSQYEEVDGGQMPLTAHHQMQLLRSQLEQQTQQTQVSVAQVHLLKDQLEVESAARIEAQARIHQLILHNRDLLDHIRQLVSKICELESSMTGVSMSSDALLQMPDPIQTLPDVNTPVAPPVILPQFRDIDVSFMNQPQNMFENTNTNMNTGSPDSGHREMSSDSLANAASHQSDAWYRPGNFSNYTNAGTIPVRANGDNATEGKRNSRDNDQVIITPLGSKDATGNMVHMKETQAVKLAPPARSQRKTTMVTNLDLAVRDRRSASSESGSFHDRSSSESGADDQFRGHYASNTGAVLNGNRATTNNLNKSDHTASLNLSAFSEDLNNVSLNQSGSVCLDNMTLEEFESLES